MYSSFNIINMNSKTNQLLSLMKIVSWIVFIGLCIQTGAIIVTTVISLFINPEAAQDLYLGLDLSELHANHRMQYLYVISFIIGLSGLKAYLFYLVIRVFGKLNLSHPFSTQVVALITKISHVALGTGIVALIAAQYCRRLLHKGIAVEQDWGGSEFLFLAGIIFILALVFKRGTEIQTENELTV